MSVPQYYLSVCAVFKDEGRYLVEWIEYHRLQGVEHFYLYDNGSTDQSRQLLDYYIAAGIVTYTAMPRYPAQIGAYADCLTSYGSRTFWLACIDLDEFLVPVASRGLPAVLKQFEDCAALGVNWALYGTSMVRTRVNGLVIQNFVCRGYDDIRQHYLVKSVVRPEAVRAACNPHYFLYHDRGAVTENRKTVESAWAPEVSWRTIRINHYFAKSEEELTARKEGRKRSGNGLVRTAAQVDQQNRNEVYDPIMLKYAPAVKRRVADVLTRMGRSELIAEYTRAPVRPLRGVVLRLLSFARRSVRWTQKAFPS